MCHIGAGQLGVSHRTGWRSLRAVSELPSRRQVPPPLTVAASLVAVQAVVLLGVAILELADITPDRAALGVSTAIFFTLYGSVLAAAALALWRLQGWSRGPVMITQLIQLGLAWNLRDVALPAIVLAASAVLAIAGVVHPDSIRALEHEDSAEESPEA